MTNYQEVRVKLTNTQLNKLKFVVRSKTGIVCFVSWLDNLGKKAQTNIPIPLARDNLPGLVSNLTSSAINKFDRKISGRGAVRAGKGFTLFISNEVLNDIFKIMKSLEDSGVITDGVTETVKDELKKQEGGFLGALLAPLAAS